MADAGARGWAGGVVGGRGRGAAWREGVGQDGEVDTHGAAVDMATRLT